MLTISVIIPVYNAAQFLEKSVQSALQFNEVKEILLIEDQSTDNSLEICQKLASENSGIKLFQHADKRNHGAGASRNLGIEKATCDFVAFLDADDYYLPNRFDAEKEILKETEIDGVFGAIGVEFLTEKGRQEFQEKFKNVSLTTVNYAAEGVEVFRGLLGLTPRIFGTFFHLNALTVRRSAVEKHRLRFNENLRVHQDSDFNIKLSYFCHLKSGIIDKAIAVRGVHDQNRITKIIPYSSQYNVRQLMLWQSLYNWAVTNNLPSAYRKRIYLSFKSFDLSQQKGFTKYVNIIWETVKNYKILKTRYRYHYFK